MNEEELNKLIKTLIEKEEYEKVNELLKNEEQKFWRTEYAKKSREEKVKYWSGMFWHDMRWNGESGVDPMAVFSKTAYISWKNREPDFDELLPEILSIIKVSMGEFLEYTKK